MYITDLRADIYSIYDAFAITQSVLDVYVQYAHINVQVLCKIDLASHRHTHSHR